MAHTSRERERDARRYGVRVFVGDGDDVAARRDRRQAELPSIGDGNRGVENRASVHRMGGEYTGTFTGGHRLRDLHIAPVDGHRSRRTPAAHASDVQTVDPT